MAHIEKTVFISYRRKDISWALAVYQDLTHHGYDVFFDYTSISGGDFEQIIISNIRARAHFVLILTPTTFDRCSEPGDWLRREVEVAIDEKRNITPLFFDGFNFGNDNVSQKLTGKLKNVSRYNGMNVHQDYFTEAMNRLRTKFLSVPLDAILHPVSTEVQEVVAVEKRAANKAAKEAKKIADRDASRKRQKEVVGKIISLISSNSRLLGIGGIILLALIFGGFGLNYLIKNLPSKTATLPSLKDTPAPLSTKPLAPVPSLGIGSTMISEKDGMVMVYVPAGTFTMGNDSNQELNQKPEHQVYLDAYWIDQTEVTNAMYAKCVDDNSTCLPPSDTTSNRRDSYYGNSEFNNFPVMRLSWYQAETYCSWAERRLPTEAEWEKAARGTDGRIYPWGNETPNANLANTDNIFLDTTEVGKYPDGKSVYGALDMAGNVMEWVNSVFQPYPYEANGVREDFSSLGVRVERGGWYVNGQPLNSSTYRFWEPPTVEGPGFRCALSP